MADGTVRCIDSEIPFDIPDSWEWVRLGSIFNHTSGKQQSSSNNCGGTPQRFITTSNLYWGRFVLDNVKIMNFTDDEIKTCSATNGDLLVCEGGAGYGRSAIWCYDYDICLQNHVHRLRPYVNGTCEYVYHFIYFLKETNQLAAVGTAMPGLSANRLKGLLMPLPPINEQQRIVAKLLNLEDYIHHYTAMDIELSNLNNDVNSKIYKSILQEAIQGRLVPQIESEGTAEELLAEIRAEKERLVKEGKLKKSALANESRIFRGDDNRYYLKNGSETECIDECPLDIPSSWKWVTLGELIVDSTGLSYKKESLADKSEPFIRVLRGGNIEDGIMRFHNDDVFISAKYVSHNLLLTKGTYISPAVSSLEKIGKTAIVDRNYTDTVVGGFVLMLTPTFCDTELGKYLYYFFQSGFYQNYCRKITKKSGQAFYNLSRKKLVLCPVPIPPKAELKRILYTLEKVLAGIMSR